MRRAPHCGPREFKRTHTPLAVFPFCFRCSTPKSEEKRGGSGSHNWGNVKDEVRWVSPNRHMACLSERRCQQDNEAHVIFLQTVCTLSLLKCFWFCHITGCRSLRMSWDVSLFALSLKCRCFLYEEAQTVNVSARGRLPLLIQRLCIFVPSEAEQTAPPETTPEGEENAPAGSENKWESCVLVLDGCLDEKGSPCAKLISCHIAFPLAFALLLWRNKGDFVKRCLWPFGLRIRGHV